VVPQLGPAVTDRVTREVREVCGNDHIPRVANDMEATNIDSAYKAIVRVDVAPEVKWILLTIGKDVALEAI
jgi:UDP-N-acetylmuramoylalanine-D-glutamate ligase